MQLGQEKCLYDGGVSRGKRKKRNWSKQGPESRKKEVSFIILPHQPSRKRGGENKKRVVLVGGRDDHSTFQYNKKFLDQKRGVRRNIKIPDTTTAWKQKT